MNAEKTTAAETTEQPKPVEPEAVKPVPEATKPEIKGLVRIVLIALAILTVGAMAAGINATFAPKKVKVWMTINQGWLITTTTLVEERPTVTNTYRTYACTFWGKGPGWVSYDQKK